MAVSPELLLLIVVDLSHGEGCRRVEGLGRAGWLVLGAAGGERRVGFSLGWPVSERSRASHNGQWDREGLCTGV